MINTVMQSGKSALAKLFFITPPPPPPCTTKIKVYRNNELKTDFYLINYSKCPHNLYKFKIF